MSALATIPDIGTISEDSRAALLATFSPLYDQADKLVGEASAIVVTDATQVTEIKKSRAIRLKLREVRIEAENARKAAKENSLRVGRVIDAIAGKIKTWCEPAEARLLEQEQFAERAEAKRKADLKAARIDILSPYVGTDSMFYNLEDMPEATFQQLFQSSKLAHESKIAAAKKAEEDRMAAEREKAEQDRLMRIENERLRREAEEREKMRMAELARIEVERKAEEAKARKERESIEAAARKAQQEADAKFRKGQEEHRKAQESAEAKARTERMAAEAIARKERESREAVEHELAAKKKAEEDARKAAALAAKKAAAAPDYDKLMGYAKHLERMEHLESVASSEANVIRDEIVDRIGELVTWIRDQAKQL